MRKCARARLTRAPTSFGSVVEGERRAATHRFWAKSSVTPIGWVACLKKNPAASTWRVSTAETGERGCWRRPPPPGGIFVTCWLGSRVCICRTRMRGDNGEFFPDNSHGMELLAAWNGRPPRGGALVRPARRLKLLALVGARHGRSRQLRRWGKSQVSALFKSEVSRLRVGDR